MHDPYDDFCAWDARFERDENTDAIEDSSTPHCVENRCINPPSDAICEDWLGTLARANAEYGTPTREMIDDVWRGLRWTIGYEKEMDNE